MHIAKKGRKAWIAVGAAGLLLGGLGAGVLIARMFSGVVEVPSSVAAQFGEAVYLPASLPGTFRIQDKSFSIHDGTLVFRAKDTAGGTIAFTEQKRPAQMNFDTFYKDYMKDAKVLDTSRHASATGYSLDGKMRLLSVVTDEIWLLASTASPLDEQSLRVIAESLGKQ